jgi:putative ABC transport system permease protein
LIRGTPGVAAIEGTFGTDASLRGKDARIWAIHRDTMFHYHLAAGRWFTAAEERHTARVAVIERDLVRTTGTRLGETIRIRIAPGPVDFRVVGISTNQQENGAALFVPLTTMHALFPGMPADASDYWVRTTSHDHAFVDRTTTRVEDVLNANGYDVSAQIVYVMLANEIAHNQTLVTSVVVLGFLIVAISMAGLANALTMSVLERTREIGVLRSIGARARDIRRIFAAETVVLASLGWLIGIPVGVLLELFLVWMTKQVVLVEVPFTFPLWNIPLALAGTIVLALLITLIPVGRAVRLRPGDALRYS